MRAQSARSANACLVAVHDPADTAAEDVARSTGARKASGEEILAAPDVDAVLVATPTDLHTACIEAAARAGKGDLLREADRFSTSTGHAPALTSSARPERG